MDPHTSGHDDGYPPEPKRPCLQHAGETSELQTQYVPETLAASFQDIYCASADMEQPTNKEGMEEPELTPTIASGLENYGQRLHDVHQQMDALAGGILEYLDALKARVTQEIANFKEELQTRFTERQDVWKMMSAQTREAQARLITTRGLVENLGSATLQTTVL